MTSKTTSKMTSSISSKLDPTAATFVPSLESHMPANKISNKNTSGFLPDERAWMDKFVDLGFIDTFRAFNTDPGQYSWWSYRAGSREKNLGWRIDYQMASKEIQNKLESAVILQNVVHSDHCPIVLKLHQ